MVINSLGYLFECRKDNFDKFGVVEVFKMVYKGNEQHVTLTCAIDGNGKIVMPAFNNYNLGFRPLNFLCKTEDDLNTFLRGNNAIYDVFGEFMMIASGTVVFDKNTGEVLSTDKMSFYLPKGLSDTAGEFYDHRGELMPSIICEKVDTRKGLNVFPISEITYNAYLSNFLSCISAESTTSRSNYIKNILFRG